MRFVTSTLGVVAAVVVALLVVPMGTAGAAPLRSVATPGATVAVAADGGSFTVTLRDGRFVPSPASNEVKVVDSRGKLVETVPLAPVSQGKVVRIGSVLSADHKTATFSSSARQVAAKTPVAKRMTKDQAYMKMMYQLNKDWPCAAPYIIGGLIIGFFFIVGWIIGGLIGAYIGYTTCNHGAAWNAAVNWWNTP